MALAVAIIVVLVVLAMVAYPIVRGGSAPWMEEAEIAAMRELAEQRDALYAAIRMLDFDRQLGNIAEDDYRRLRSRYVRRAAGVLREIEGWEMEMEQELEREVEALLQEQGDDSSVEEARGARS